ncbi:YIP1 family protein [Melioribacter roseus]|uniref:YIP1 family protein n=1 Tax=Melioribacter roseus TaxID=1134405 RepID=UPI0012FEFD19|nr:YIP1 family protein [Melioribacter roseus]
MKNSVRCNNCSTENPFYLLTCENCKAFLRTKVPNIDFWHTTSKLFESPVKAAELLIHADHKNFLLTVIILAALKISLTAGILSNVFSGGEGRLQNIFVALSSLPISFILLMLAWSVLMTLILKITGVKSRFKDNLAIYSYSFIPIIFTLILLTPVEYALFGQYWFSFNPTPFAIKYIPSIVLSIIEGIFIVWSMFLAICATYAQSRSLFFSILIGALFLIVTVGIPVYLAYVLNNPV